MGRDWVRLGLAVKAARETLGMTQVELAEALDVDESTLQNLETARYGKGFSRMPASARAAAHYFSWAEGSLEAVLSGGEPVTAAPTEGVPPAPPRSEPDSIRKDLPLRIIDELRGEGPLIDTTVIELPTAGPNVSMTIVVQGTPDASPEEIKQALLAWRRAERRLQRLDDEGPVDDEPSVMNEV